MLSTSRAGTRAARALGAGGRSSVSGVVATVFGNTGFLGRYVVNQLGRMGSQVCVPFRGEEKAQDHLKVMGDLGQVAQVPFHIRDRRSVEAAVQHSNVVVNLIGRHYATRNFTLEQANVATARAVAEACARSPHQPRLVHVSCNNADEYSPSALLRAKAHAERTVRDVYPQATVLRLTTVWGDEDRFLNRYGTMAKFWPVFPLFHPRRQLQPQSAFDAAAAIVAAAQLDDAVGRTLVVGGPTVYELDSLLEELFHVMLLHPRTMRVTSPTARRVVARALQRLRRPLFTDDEMLQMDEDDVVPAAHVDDAVLLGVAGTQLHLEDTAVNTLRKYRRAPDLYLDADEADVDEHEELLERQARSALHYARRSDRRPASSSAVRIRADRAAAAGAPQLQR